ncbi:cell fate (sporulation/competence/biofilm development) regulator YlbF (YheA/YmcA/DUF963 family) [Weissella uvarum]|uniref:YlbF family regulator n=1 Tax=Weissella uvarum TaxID=1479233 RepID=UPI001961068B|nr:YlbF family regulator [Weissella uvarum]MBM7617139.1 cell fate (sporulation/competence/biofilm development) regulator YlbF (YheA/YmcA/DUF963 family) [Weissella uvarum]MCM0595435.1 YlbF family regulator [Weissella uvarum]
MVNIFDNINAAAKDLEETPQYKNLAEALKAVRADEKANEVFNRFQQTQVNINQAMQNGEEPTEDQIQAWQSVAQEVEEYDVIKQLMETEQAMNQLLMQINNALTKPIADLYE